MAILSLLVALAAQGCLAYRLEGQIFNEQELAATGLHDESSEVAFSLSSSSTGRGGRAEATNATEGEEEGEVDQECQLAVSGSASKQRGTRCECPEGTVAKCSGEPCNKFGRSFRPKAFSEKSCSCQKCDARCESVPGAKTRTSGWRRITGRDCECEEGLLLAGDDVRCNAKGKEERYFKSKRVIDRGCFCTTAATASEKKGRSAPTTQGGSEKATEGDDTEEAATPPQMASGHEPEKEEAFGHIGNPKEGLPEVPMKWYENKDSSKWLWTLFGGGLVCCCLTTVCRVFKAAMEAEDEEDVVEQKTTDTSVEGRPSEAWVPYQKEVRTYDNSRGVGAESFRSAGAKASGA